MGCCSAALTGFAAFLGILANSLTSNASTVLYGLLLVVIPAITATGALLVWLEPLPAGVILIARAGLAGRRPTG